MTRSSSSPADDRSAPDAGPDPRAWPDRHGDALFRYALIHLGGDREAAEDRVQETFVAALTSLESFRGDASERTWLVGILRHKICDLLRRRTRRSATEPAGGEAVSAMFKSDDHWRQAPGRWRDVEGQADREEMGAVLRECLLRLDPALHEVVSLRDIQGLDMEKVREILGLTATNLSTRLYRARALLRACLERRWFDRGS